MVDYSTQRRATLRSLTSIQSPLAITVFQIYGYLLPSIHLLYPKIEKEPLLVMVFLFAVVIGVEPTSRFQATVFKTV